MEQLFRFCLQVMRLGNDNLTCESHTEILNVACCKVCMYYHALNKFGALLTVTDGKKICVAVYLVGAW